VKNVADIYGLSPMQSLMLLHTKTANADHDVLFNQIVYVIEGLLDAAAYRRAWQLIVDRHSALRTLFVWQDGQDPVQVVREQVTLPWNDIDWRGRPAAEQAADLDQLLAADLAEGFDLLRPPAMRLSLIQVAEEQYWLVWSSHHLVIDRWCIGIIFEEISIAYEAFVSGEFPSLPAAPLYRDYIAWLAEQDEDAARAYWREALRDLQPQSLPLVARTAPHTAALETIETGLAGDEWARLRRFALDHDLTHGTLLTAAWAAVLAAASGTNDTLFGLTVSGRPADLADVSQAVGCFINNVPLRVNLDSGSMVEATTVGWLQNLQEQQMELKPFEYASPVQIQTWSELNTYGPLFETLVVLQAPVHLAMPQNLSIRYAQGGMQTGYPLSLGAVPDEAELSLSLTYDRSRVPESMAGQVASGLIQVLRALPEAADRPPSTLTAILGFEEAGTPRQPQSGLVAGEDRPYTAPRTITEGAIALIWATLLNLPQVGIEDRFFDLGGDSINAIQLLSLIEARLGRRLPISLLFRNPTVAELAAEIGEETLMPADPVLQPVNERGTNPPFFYVHGVFGDVSYLHNLGPLMEADQPIYGLEAIGLRPGQEPDLTIEAMAARYIEAMRRLQPSGPYYVGGFCLGGVVAYEIARQLEQAGETTALLAIIEGSAPFEFHYLLPVYHPERLQIIRQSAPYWARGNKEFGGWRLGARLQARARRKRGESPKVNRRANQNVEFDNLADFNATRPEIQFQVREVNIRAVDAYVPGAYGGHIILYRARAVQIGHAFRGKIDPQRGWGRLAKGGVSIRYVDGNHIGILVPPYVNSLASTITSDIDQAREQHRPAKRPDETAITSY
jgi:thioesterase domain-containing protein/acyl carrier protein